MKYLIYCTKAKPYLKKCNHFMALSNHRIGNEGIELNGKIIAEFECDKVEEYANGGNCGKYCYYLDYLEVLKPSCLTENELINYSNDLSFYAIHIKNLKVFYKPLELNEVYHKGEHKKCSKCNKCNCPNYRVNGGCYCELIYEKAPSNMCYVWYKGEKYCLISCSSKECVNLLNGKATILVRKKVLKEMIK